MEEEKEEVVVEEKEKVEKVVEEEKIQEPL